MNEGSAPGDIGAVMRKRWTLPVLRSFSALTSGVLGFTMAMNLVATEAGGGRLTGPLIDLCLFGSVVLLVCAAMLFTRRSAVTVMAVVAALLCVPLLVYRIAPVAFSWVADAPASVVPGHLLNLDPLAVCELVAVLVLVARCVRVPGRAE